MRSRAWITPGLGVRHAGSLHSLPQVILDCYPPRSFAEVRFCCHVGALPVTHSRGCQLLHAIVGRLSCDDNVVDVAFSETRGSDAHEAARAFEIVERGGTQVTHAAL